MTKPTASPLLCVELSTGDKKRIKSCHSRGLKRPLKESFSVLLLLFHSHFHQGNLNQNVIMFNTFASRAVTKSLSQVRSSCRKHQQIARCHPSLLFFPSLTPRYLIAIYWISLLSVSNSISNYPLLPWLRSCCWSHSSLFLTAPLEYICFQQSHRQTLLVSHRVRVGEAGCGTRACTRRT